MRSLRLATWALFSSLAAPALTAQLTNDDSVIPNEGSFTENVDFADVDLDGDWDVAVADGGDAGDDQNRLWINMGGAQGGTQGVFSDETASRMPSIQDDSRDVEFGDFDADGDVDMYISNTAQLATQGNRWLINNGSGTYTDETGLHWVDLGVNGSSIPASLVIPAGNPGGGDTFVDWSCDCDFGDLDNDGDLDLFHSSYGGAFGGDVPSRVFLNDGSGKFKEFNPSGFQLFTAEISDGQPGLWCEGVHDSNTNDGTGAECDIAATALDIDVGDFDGDFDLDVLHGARGEHPRIFANRLEGSFLAPDNGGALLFRDVTFTALPSGSVPGGGNYEQEIGDMDGDGDLDIYGLNWGGGAGGSGLSDVVIENTGNGTFVGTQALTGSSADDNEGDFMDYDNDGDLDIFVANFSGGDRLYRNNNNGSGSGFTYTEINFGTIFVTSLDADVCDTDGDGDYDVLVAADGGQPNRFYRNTTQVPDTHAPYIPNVESVTTTVDGSTPVPIRAHVYDNAPYYITWYNPTEVDVEVCGVSMGTFPAVSSQGQIFRVELPGNLHGDVTYTFRSEDEYGNQGASAPTTSTFSSPGVTSYGTGTLGTTGEPELKALTVPMGGSDLYLLGDGGPPSTPCILALGNLQVPTTPIGSIVTLNIFSTGPFLVQEFAVTDGNGQLLRVFPITASTPPGFTAYGQFFTLNGTSQLYASSKGLALTVQ